MSRTQKMTEVDDDQTWIPTSERGRSARTTGHGRSVPTTGHDGSILTLGQDRSV